MYQKIKDSQGLTLLEILIVIAVLAVITLLAMPYMTSAQTKEYGRNIASEMVSSMRLAQTQSVAGLNNNTYGIHFENDSYTIFIGDTYQLNNEDNLKHDIEKGYVLASYTLSNGGNDIVFSKNTGVPNDWGKIILQNNHGDEVKIEVNKIGLISYE